MKTRTKAIVAGAASAFTMVATCLTVSAPAQAESRTTAETRSAQSMHDVRSPSQVLQWTRSCGTTYGALTTSAYARTTKGSNGHCAGGAWVRVKWRGAWSSWVYDAKDARISVGSGLQAAQHKGCANCEVKTTRP